MLRNRTTLAIPLILLGAACSSSPAAIADAAATTDAPVVFDAVHTVDAALTCPPAACHVADLTCLAARSNVGASTFLMSMMQVTYAKPTVLTSGLVAQVFTAGLSPNSPTCGLTGDGLESWLLQFDTTAQTIKTGTGTADQSGAYSFTDAAAGGFQVQPASLNATIGIDGSFSTPSGGNLVIGIALSSTTILPVPIHELSLSGTLSSSNTCIGSYNGSALEPSNACAPQGSATTFTNAGEATGYITLAEADTVIVAAVNQSLCVLLSGNATMYGSPNGSNVTVCKVDGNGNILFQGDWCSVTNAAATETCADAVAFDMHFAAGGVPAQ